MATVTIRRLDESVKGKLRVRAAQHGRSMEEEVREILTAAVKIPAGTNRNSSNWIDDIRLQFARLGGVELDIPAREPMRDPPDFNEWFKRPNKVGRRTG